MMTPLTPETGQAAVKAIPLAYALRTCTCWTTETGVTVVSVTTRRGAAVQYFYLEALAKDFPLLYFGV